MNQQLENKYKELGIEKKVYEFGEKIEESLKGRFEEIDRNAELNQMKVIAAMQKNKVSAECFNISSGYGYNDMGRDTLERVYADCFGGEDALVRPQITCGTHALALALMSNLRPGDELLSPVGKPYDTLEEVIGIRPSKGSLAEYGITYAQVDLLSDGSFDYEGIKAAINERTKLVTIQRSKGYATRPTLSVQRIGELIAVKAPHSAVKRSHDFSGLICLLSRCRFLHFLPITDHPVKPEIASLFCLQKLVSCFCADKGKCLPLRILSLFLNFLSQILCHKKQIVHHFCRIFKHNMIHFLKHIVLSPTENLICMVHGSVPQWLDFCDFSLHLKFADNFFKFDHTDSSMVFKPHFSSQNQTVSFTKIRSLSNRNCPNSAISMVLAVS